MSSTTDGSRERAQILVLFVLSLAAILLFAALAFDVGRALLDKRDQQNAADAAALAGARYVLTDSGQAETAAREIAARNGFAEGGDVHVAVHIPPIHGEYAGYEPGFIEVEITTSKPSIFAEIAGKSSWDVGAYAVAANQPGLTYSFGMLALDDSACKAIHVSGDGLVYSRANIVSNSSGVDCGTGDKIGFSRTGGGTITIDTTDAACRSVGKIQDQGSGDMVCSKEPNRSRVPDPLRGLPAPVKPALAAAMVHPNPLATSVSNATTPVTEDPSKWKYCPGNTAFPPSETSPAKCVIGSGAATAGKTWILSPGLYPGGLDIKASSTVYLLPGIYWIGGGGVSVAGDSSVSSVSSTYPLVPGTGGILIYNSKLPGALGAAGPITLGGSGATVKLEPLAYDPPGWPDPIDIVIFQDRTVNLTGYDVTLNGSASGTSVRGIIYLPLGDMKMNGNGGTLTVDQVIAATFLVDGNSGTINVMHDRFVDAKISGFGLVE